MTKQVSDHKIIAYCDLLFGLTNSKLNHSNRNQNQTMLKICLWKYGLCGEGSEERGIR